jgi:uncharacterized protein (TIGR00730 family)
MSIRELILDSHHHDLKVNIMPEKKDYDAHVEHNAIKDEYCLKSMKHKFRVVIFGSARIVREDENWKIIYELAKKIAKEGMDLVTGGGPGLMDAASEGHYAGDPDKKTVQSIGLQIQLPREQRSAHHLDIKREFSQFSERLDNFIELANIVVVAPGGVGTTLELFYTWQLLQVKMIRNIPIILLGDMWSDFLRWITKWPLQHQFLEQKDVDLLFLANNSSEAFDIIKCAYNEFKTRTG